MAHPESTDAELHGLLEEAARSGLVLLIRGADAGTAESADAGFSYRFAHDRVQQLVYERIPLKERDELHLRSGRGLLAGTQLDDSERIFDIAHHLNSAPCLMRAPE